jgi:endonuclease-3
LKRQEKANRIRAQLERRYVDTPIPLTHTDPFTLLVAVLLSAQTTDKKVNEVTPALFGRWPTVAAMAEADPAAVLPMIRVIGLAPTKARNVVGLSRKLVADFDGEVPADFAALESLPGVGHKTASVVMSQAFGVPAFAVDTHIHRLAWRWGLSSGKNVVRTEADLKRVFPRESWIGMHLRIIYFGREHCPARGHTPEACPICSWAGVKSRLSTETAKRR